jgi:hypothetical protein
MALVFEIISDTKLGKSLDEISEKIKKAGGEGEKAGSKMKMAFAAVNAIIATGIITGVVMLTKRMVDLASTAEETKNKFDVVFKGVSNATLSVNKLSQSTGYAKSTIHQMMGSLGDLIKPAGFAADKAFELSDGIVKLSMDIGSFSNVAPQQVIEDFQSAIAGSSETMTKYGIDVKEGSLAQEAFNMGLIKSAKEYSRLNPEQLRNVRLQALISKAYKDSKDAIGDLGRTQDSYANQMRQFDEGLKSLMESLGQSILPYATKLVKEMNEMVTFGQLILEKIRGTKKDEPAGATAADKERMLLIEVNNEIKKTIALETKLSEAKKAGRTEEQKETFLLWNKQKESLNFNLTKNKEIVDLLFEKFGIENTTRLQRKTLLSMIEKELALTEKTIPLEKEKQKVTTTTTDAVTATNDAIKEIVDTSLPKWLEISVLQRDVNIALANEYERLLMNQQKREEAAQELLTTEKELPEHADDLNIAFTKSQQKTNDIRKNVATGLANGLQNVIWQAGTLEEKFKSIAMSVVEMATKMLIMSGVKAAFNMIGLPFLQEGGLVPGYAGGGTITHGIPFRTQGTRDNVIVHAEQGEFIEPRRAVNSSTLPILEAIRQGKTPQSSGGGNINININTSNLDSVMITQLNNRLRDIQKFRTLS